MVTTSHETERLVSQAAALYYLQTLDSDRGVSQKRLAEVEELLGQDEAIRLAQAAHDEADSTLRAGRGHVHDLEMAITSLESKIKSTEERLYNGSVSNPRELQSMQEEVASLHRRIGSLEEELLEAMMGVEESETAAEEAHRRLEAITQERSDELRALTGEKETLESRLKTLSEEIARARGQISAEHLRLYDEVRSTHGGLAVAQVVDGVCGVCGVGPTSSQLQRVQHGEVECCPTCGRILYSKV
jgi:predicted  nucleic acid-binding Zn-ribbon protein